MKKFRLAIAAAALGGLTFTNPAFAKSVTFSYTEKELANEEAASKLMERISKTARNACRSNSPYVTSRSERACADDVARQLITSINHPLLFAASNSSQIASRVAVR